MVVGDRGGRLRVRVWVCVEVEGEVEAVGVGVGVGKIHAGCTAVLRAARYHFLLDLWSDDSPATCINMSPVSTECQYAVPLSPLRSTQYQMGE